MNIIFQLEPGERSDVTPIMFAEAIIDHYMKNYKEMSNNELRHARNDMTELAAHLNVFLDNSNMFWYKEII